MEALKTLVGMLIVSIISFSSYGEEVQQPVKASDVGEMIRDYNKLVAELKKETVAYRSSSTIFADSPRGAREAAGGNAGRPGPRDLQRHQRAGLVLLHPPVRRPGALALAGGVRPHRPGPDGGRSTAPGGQRPDPVQSGQRRGGDLVHRAAGLAGDEAGPQQAGAGNGASRNRSELRRTA